MKLNLQESGIQPYGGSAPLVCRRWRMSANRQTNTRLPSGANPALARKSRMNRTFTLIELLVVIAIIAVLAAMLLPALSVAKNRAQMVIDLNHVHQILLATHMYCNDNNDYMPRPGPGWAACSGQTIIPNWCFGNPWNVAPAGGTRATYDIYYPLQVRSFKGLKPDGTPALRMYAAQLSPYLKNEKVMRCPADIPNPNMYKRQVYLTSYIWSTVVVGGQMTPWVPAAGCISLQTLKLKDFTPSCILMWENDELNAVEWGDLAAPPGTRISSRHGKGATVGRFDGSADRMNLKTLLDMAASPPSAGPNDCFCNPLQGNGHGADG